MFLINCTNKGCGKNTEAILDTSDNEVHCSDCDGVISNITSFTKSHLKNIKQVKKTKQSFSYKCESCGTDARPKLINDKLYCIKCNVHLSKITKSYEILIKNIIKNDDDI